MELSDFPANISPYIIPQTDGHMEYRCLVCHKTHSIDNLLYTCPVCGGVLLIYDLEEKEATPIWKTLAPDI